MMRLVRTLLALLLPSCLWYCGVCAQEGRLRSNLVDGEHAEFHTDNVISNENSVSEEDATLFNKDTPTNMTTLGLEEDLNKTKRACVSLEVYQDSDCSGDPVRYLTFPTWTEPGSPCYHDATMGGSSVKDQYCDLDANVWHETVYPINLKCDATHWYDSWSIMRLKFVQGHCTLGFQLNYCKRGRCPKENEDGSPVIEELLLDSIRDSIGSKERLLRKDPSEIVMGSLRNLKIPE